MVRLDNRFTLRLEEDLYDPDAIGACCKPDAQGNLCDCESEVTGRDCCLAKGQHFPGQTCASDIPGNPLGITCCTDETTPTGACCKPCKNDPTVFGGCVDGETEAQCESGGGQWQGAGSGCANGVCVDCPDNTVYVAKQACCTQCLEGNLGRNGNCGVLEATGNSIEEAINNLPPCAGDPAGIFTGTEDSPPPDPCGEEPCPSCNRRTRPCCEFCPKVGDTGCASTQSGSCYEFEQDLGGDPVGEGCNGNITLSPNGAVDVTCADLRAAGIPCSGSDKDCIDCQDVCCCQDGEANPTPFGQCAGEVLKDVPVAECQDLLCNEELFYCLECATSSCSADGAVVVGGGAGSCSATVTLETTCRVIAQNTPCGGAGQVDAEKGDLGDNVDCNIYGGQSPCTVCAGFGTATLLHSLINWLQRVILILNFVSYVQHVHLRSTS